MNKFFKILLPILIVLCLAVGFTAGSLLYINNSAKQMPISLYYEEENTLDGVLFGTSSLYTFFAPPEAYRNHGAAIGLYAASGLPLVTMKYMISAALEDQDPDFIAIDIRNVSNDLTTRETYMIKHITDYMPATKARLDLINGVAKFGRKNETGVSGNPLDYAYPITENDIEEAQYYREKYSIHKGFPIHKKKSTHRKVKFKDPIEWTDESGDIPGANMMYMEDLLDYCETLDCKVMFFITPCALKESRQLICNKALEMAKERGFDVRNFNRDDGLEKMNMTVADFYNDRHANVYGAVKFTEYFYRYLNSRYNLKDHRGDKKYKSWDEASVRLRSDIMEAINRANQY